TAVTTPTTTEGSDSGTGDAVVPVGSERIEDDVREVSVGQTITLQNDDDEGAVSVTSEDGAIDIEVQAGESYEHTFEEAGTYTLTVGEADGATLLTIIVTE